MSAFAESRPVYDPLTVLDLLNDRQTPSVNLPTTGGGIQMPSLPDGSSSPLASRPSELTTGMVVTNIFNQGRAGNHLKYQRM